MSILDADLTWLDDITYVFDHLGEDVILFQLRQYSNPVQILKDTIHTSKMLLKALRKKR